MDMAKLDALASKMNKITAELTKNVETSEKILVTTDDLGDLKELDEIAGSRDPKTYSDLLPPTTTTPSPIPPTTPDELNVTAMAGEVLDVQNMIQDFQYMRQMLKEATQNSKTVLEATTVDLMEADEESRTSLIMAYSELNKAQLEGIRLFMQSYKEISAVIANFAKIQKDTRTGANTYTTNVLNIDAKDTSTADIISRLRG